MSLLVTFIRLFWLFVYVSFSTCSTPTWLFWSFSVSFGLFWSLSYVSFGLFWSLLYVSCTQSSSSTIKGLFACLFWSHLSFMALLVSFVCLFSSHLYVSFGLICMSLFVGKTRIFYRSLLYATERFVEETNIFYMSLLVSFICLFWSLLCVSFGLFYMSLLLSFEVSFRQRYTDLCRDV